MKNEDSDMNKIPINDNTTVSDITKFYVYMASISDCVRVIIPSKKAIYHVIIVSITDVQTSSTTSKSTKLNQSSAKTQAGQELLT